MKHKKHISNLKILGRIPAAIQHFPREKAVPTCTARVAETSASDQALAYHGTFVETRVGGCNDFSANGTPRKTNMEPENGGPLEEEILYLKPSFSGSMLVFGGVNWWFGECGFGQPISWGFFEIRKYKKGKKNKFHNFRQYLQIWRSSKNILNS